MLAEGTRVKLIRDVDLDPPPLGEGYIHEAGHAGLVVADQGDCNDPDMTEIQFDGETMVWWVMTTDLQPE